MNPYLAIAAYIAVGYTVGYLLLAHFAERTQADGQYDPDDIIFFAIAGIGWPVAVFLFTIWWTFTRFTNLIDTFRGRR